MKSLVKISILFFSLLLVACTSIKLPPIAHYTLMSEPATQAVHARTSLTLFVNQPIAAPGYDSNRLIFVSNPYQLQSYARGQWVAPPAQMLGQLITQQIRNSGYFHAVMMPPFVGMTDYRLELRLLMLQQENSVKISQVHLIMWAALLDNSQKIIATQTFDISLPTSADAYQGVQTANQAAEMLAQKISQFLISGVQKK